MKRTFCQFILAAQLLALSATSQAQPDTLWTRYYDSATDLWARDVQEMTSGDWLIAGQEEYNPANGLPWMHAARVYSDGELAWSRHYDLPQWPGDLPPAGFACLTLPRMEDSFTLIGTYVEVTPVGQGTVEYHPFGCLVHCYPNGDSALTEAFPLMGEAIFWCGTLLPDGGAIVAGRTGSNVAWENVLIARVSPEGEIEWWNAFPYATGFIPNRVARTADGGFLIAGWYGFPLDMDVDDLPSVRFHLVRTDAGGNFLWERTFQYLTQSGRPGVVERADGTILFACTARMIGSPEWLSRVFVLSADGDSLDMHSYEVEEMVRDLRLLPDNTAMLVSTLYTQPLNDQVRLTHLSEDLSVLGTLMIGGGGWDALCNFTRLSDGGWAAVGHTTVPGDSNFHYYAAHLSSATAVNGPNGQIPSVFAFSAFPNPFNATTTITFSLPMAGAVKLNVFDVTGRLAATLVDQVMTTGQHRMFFDAANLPSGAIARA